MPNATRVGGIQGYGLLATAVNTKVGGIQGYALVRTTPLPNFTLTYKTALLVALNKQYKTAFTATQILFGAPQVVVGDEGYNTRVLITADRTSGYSGNKYMRYNRVDLSHTVAGKDLTLPGTGMGSTLWTSLAAINTKFGLALTTADVVDKNIAGATGITIVTSDTSGLFIPGSSIRLGTSIPTMSQVFNTVEMTNPLTIEASKTAQDSLKAVFLSTVSAVGVGVVKTDFAMEDPVVITGVKNTSVKLNAVNLTAVTGSQVLRYDRRPLGSIASLFTTAIEMAAGNSSVWALLDRINVVTGFLLEVRDLEDTAIVEGATEVTLVAAATSYAFIPGSTLAVTLHSTSLPLDSIITNSQMNGFESAVPRLEDDISNT